MQQVAQRVAIFHLRINNRNYQCGPNVFSYASNSLEIFSDTQGQLTPQSEVKSFEKRFQPRRDLDKNECAKSATFFKHSLAANCTQWYDLVKFRTHSRFYGCPCYLQERRRIKALSCHLSCMFIGTFFHMLRAINSAV